MWPHPGNSYGESPTTRKVPPPPPPQSPPLIDEFRFTFDELIEFIKTIRAGS